MTINYFHLIILFFALISMVIIFQIYYNTHIKAVKGEVVKIDSYNMLLEIKIQNDGIKTFIVDDGTLIFKKNNKQSNFNSLKLKEIIEIEYKPIFLQKLKADIIRIIKS